MIDPRALARELHDARANKASVTAPTTRDGGLDLATAYATEAELVRLRQESGRCAVGLKVGFANKAMWRALKLDTLVWAHIYDDTVSYAESDHATVSISKMYAPKIEPEIVFKLKSELPADTDAAGVLEAVEWIALGFEIIDCAYPDWKFTPVDFVASYGLHAGLVVGTPLRFTADQIPALVDQLAAFTVSLQKNAAVAAQGAGTNSLRSPALCLAELSSATAKVGAHLGTGDLVSSGTLTEAQLIAAGDTFTAVVEGLNVAPLTARIIA
ncbi:MAG: fumarylacetoacetate hydrolase family protein [Acidobacteriota bacterium]